MYPYQAHLISDAAQSWGGAVCVGFPRSLYARGFPHERHSTLRVQSPEGTLAHRAVQEKLYECRKLIQILSATLKDLQVFIHTRI